MHMLRAIWRSVHKHLTPVLISFLGLLCGLSAHLKAFGMSVAVAHALGGIAVFLILLGLALLYVPRHKEEVEWIWEKALLGRVLAPEQSPVLCRRHATARAQGRVLGCGAAASAEEALRWAEGYIAVLAKELTLEEDAGFAELIEHTLYIYRLLDALAALANMDFMKSLESIEQDSTDGAGPYAAAIQTDIRSLREHTERYAAKALEDLLVNVLGAHKDTTQLPSTVQGEIRGKLEMAREYLSTIAVDNARTARRTAGLLKQMLQGLWEQDRQVVRSNSACTGRGN
jgi:hypothetical protein